MKPLIRKKIINKETIYYINKIVKYIYIPQLTPMINLPKNSISYDFAILVKPIRQAPPIPRTLFNSSPPFLFFFFQKYIINNENT